jgi:CRISPR-associated exonuclease Cas4
MLVVEYKRRKPKPHTAHEVQLCAQAFCFEEMLHRPVENGARSSRQRRRRTDVLFDEELRRSPALQCSGCACTR